MNIDLKPSEVLDAVDALKFRVRTMKGLRSEVAIRGTDKSEECISALDDHIHRLESIAEKINLALIF